MKRPNGFDEFLSQMWNDFADVVSANDIVLESFKCGVVERNEGNSNTLSFNFDTPGGMSDAEAKLIFMEYLDKYPHCSIIYNQPVELEERLKDKSQVTIRVEPPSVKMERIDSF